MKYLALLFLLPGCNRWLYTPPTCVTTCGSVLFDRDGAAIDDQEACAAFQLAEDRVVALYQPDTCTTLRDLKVTNMGVESWPALSGGNVGGQTFCAQKIIRVGSACWQKNGYAHEVMHVLECPTTDNLHRTWEDNNQWKWKTVDQANVIEPGEC